MPWVPSIDALGRRWNELLRTTPPVCEARVLYQGRSMTEAVAVAEQLAARLYIVSAGIGLVAASRLVPGYDCTVATGSVLGRRLLSEGFGPSHWWNQMASRNLRPLSRLLSRSPSYLALPASYLRLVHDDLASVPASAAQHLRIFTSPAGAREVPTHLVACVLPYDDRLESVPAFAGTQMDFPQRALRHFVQSLGGQALTLKEAQPAVAAALSKQHRRNRPERVRLSDDDIQEILTAQWARFAGSSTRLLRYLRDEALVSCEQKRFSRLWQTLAARLGA